MARDAGHPTPPTWFEDRCQNKFKD